MCSSKACSVCERDRLITQLMEAREALILLRLRKQFSKLDVLILDELGYVPASEIGSALLFDVISSAYECQSLIVTTICACPFECYSSMPLLAGRKGVNSETVIKSESQRVRESESQRVREFWPRFSRDAYDLRGRQSPGRRSRLLVHLRRRSLARTPRLRTGQGSCEPPCRGVERTQEDHPVLSAG